MLSGFICAFTWTWVGLPLGLLAGFILSFTPSNEPWCGRQIQKDQLQSFGNPREQGCSVSIMLLTKYELFQFLMVLETKFSMLGPVGGERKTWSSRISSLQSRKPACNRHDLGRGKKPKIKSDFQLWFSPEIGHFNYWIVMLSGNLK